MWNSDCTCGADQSEIGVLSMYLPNPCTTSRMQLKVNFISGPQIDKKKKKKRKENKKMTNKQKPEKIGQKLWNMVTVIPVVVGAPGIVPKEIKGRIKTISTI